MKMNIDIKKLQCAMASKCYNASDLALYSKLSNATITRIFKSGSIGSLPTLGRIAKALDVKPVDLIKDEWRQQKKARGNQPQAKKGDIEWCYM